jgi:transposase
MVLDRLVNYLSVSAACRDLAPKLNIRTEMLSKGVMQAQVEVGVMLGATSEQVTEVSRLKRENAELRETNDILKAAAALFS